MKIDVKIVLTADVQRTVEGSGYLRIQLDHEVALLGDVIVPLPDELGDPYPERISDERVDNVDQPLARLRLRIAAGVGCP